MSILAWTEPSDQESSGVDHLGMRVAGEQAYSRFFDFTTSVTWRPRYYPFFCWLTRFAFIKAGGNLGAANNRIDLNIYRKVIKQVEYGIAAATIINDPEFMHIAGSTKISEAIESSNTNQILLKGDHLKASSGGLSIYGGPMRNLGILASSVGVDIPLPGSPGDLLADMFDESVKRCNAGNKLQDIVEIDDLKIIGNICSLSNFDTKAKEYDYINEELESLKDVIIDWDSFLSGSGKSARRILSIGIILESRKLLPDEPYSLDRFRELTLLGAAKTNKEIIQFSLPDTYNTILKEWRAYQNQAYITYALESLLGVLLSFALDLQATYGERLPYTFLIETALNGIERGADLTKLVLPEDLSNWWDMSLSDLHEHLTNIVELGRKVDTLEPEIHNTLVENTKRLESANQYTWVHDASILLLLTLSRLTHLTTVDGEQVWLGGNEAFRLPPKVLNNIFLKHVQSEESIKAFLHYVYDKLVLEQHASNALRKLFFQPNQDTAKFIREGENIIPLSLHGPGTSDPRYVNAVNYLQELGFLTHSLTPLLTDEGELLRERIARGF